MQLLTQDNLKTRNQKLQTENYVYKNADNFDFSDGDYERRDGAGSGAAVAA